MSEYTLGEEADYGSALGSLMPASTDVLAIIQSSTGRLRKISVASLFGAGASTNASQLGTGSGQWAVYGSPMTTQPTGAAGAAIISTAPTSTTPFGYVTSTQAAGVVSLLNYLQATFVALGVIRGS